MERFAELGFPGAREEAWKYTSLRRLESRRFVPAAPTTEPVDVPATFVARRLVLVNGSPVGVVPAALGGFALGTLATAPEAQLLRALGGGGTERFAALNAALTTGPLLLSTAAGQQSDEVLQLTLITTGAGPTLASTSMAGHMAPGRGERLLGGEPRRLRVQGHRPFRRGEEPVEQGRGALERRAEAGDVDDVDAHPDDHDAPVTRP